MTPTRYQRFASVARALTAFKAKPQTRVVSLVQTAFPGGVNPTYSARTFESYVREGYKRNELVYSAITATANTAASVALQIRDKGTEKVQRESQVQKLIQRPNAMMDEFDLWTTTIVHMKLAGVSYWQKIRGGANQVVELWPIRPDYVLPKVDEGSGLTSYEIKIGGIVVDELPAADVLRFPLPDPMGLFSVLSPIEVLARSADVDNQLTDFLKQFMERGAVPQGILSSKLRLNDDAIIDIRERWSERYGGYANWVNAPAVLDSDATYQKIGLSFDEMKFDALDGRNETRICMVLQTPPIIIGATAGLARSTFSNYESARKQWWEDVLMSLYARIVNVINQQLVPEFDDSLIARWDFSKVPALQEDATARWTRAQAAWDSGLLTRNEARKEMGKGSVGTEGNVFKESSTATMTPDDPIDDTPDGENAPVADSEEGDTTEGKAVGYKGLETDEQRRWFFANLDEVDNRPGKQPGVSTGPRSVDASKVGLRISRIDHHEHLTGSKHSEYTFSTPAGQSTHTVQTHSSHGPLKNNPLNHTQSFGEAVSRFEAAQGVKLTNLPKVKPLGTTHGNNDKFEIGKQRDAYHIHNQPGKSLSIDTKATANAVLTAPVVPQGDLLPADEATDVKPIDDITDDEIEAARAALERIGIKFDA